MNKVLYLSIICFFIVSSVSAQEAPEPGAPREANTTQDDLVSIDLDEAERTEKELEPLSPEEMELGEGVEEVVIINDEADIDAYLQQLADERATITSTDLVQVTETTSEGAVNCFDYYEFNSVEIQIGNPVDTVLPGEPQTFSVSLTNLNPYPLVDGKLFIKIFRERADGVDAEVNGDHIVDSFVALERVVLPGNGVPAADTTEGFESTPTLSTSFEWTPSRYLPAGNYYAAGYFITSDRFNLAGLSFTDDIIGGKEEFAIVNSKDALYFDKDKVLLNSEPHQFIAAAPRIDGLSPIAVEAPIVNETSEDLIGLVTWRVYYWDAQRDMHLIESVDEAVMVPAEGNAVITYNLRDTQHAVYHVVPTLSYNGEVVSKLNVRFVRSDVDEPRINFPALTRFPLVAGEEVTMFSCLHNSGTNDVVPDTSLTLTLSDVEGVDLHSYTYEGVTTGAMMAVADSFIPQQDYTQLSLKAVLKSGNKILDEVVVEYDCSQISSPECESKEEVAPGSVINPTTVVGAILIAMLVWIFVRRKQPYFDEYANSGDKNISNPTE